MCAVIATLVLYIYYGNDMETQNNAENNDIAKIMLKIMTWHRKIMPRNNITRNVKIWESGGRALLPFSPIFTYFFDFATAFVSPPALKKNFFSWFFLQSWFSENFRLKTITKGSFFWGLFSFFLLFFFLLFPGYTILY